MATNLTVKELMKRKAELKEKKTKKQTQKLYIKSLDANIVIEKPEKSVVIDALSMDEGGDDFMVYECVVEPKLKSAELHKEFEVSHEPTKIVDMLFEKGEITNIAQKCLELSGYGNSVQVVEEVKN